MRGIDGIGGMGSIDGIAGMGSIGAINGRATGRSDTTGTGALAVTCAAAGEATARPTTNEIDSVCFI
jgi:hypothetical protein